MTELRTPSASAPEASSLPSEPPSRSGLVTFSAIVVVIMPTALLATVLATMPDSAPVWSTVKRGDIGGILGIAGFLGVLALVTLAGIAIANRWRGWRVYSGTMGWFFVILSIFVVGFYLQDLDVAPYVAPSAGSRAMPFVAAAAALLGIILLVAKREEPPPRPARPMTAIGIVSIAIGLAVLAATLTYAPDRLTAAAPAAIGGVIALIGLGIVLRGPGWRIYAACLAWLLITFGIIGFFTNMPSFYHPAWLSRMWMHASTVALCIGIGYFILWSKRREPRRAPIARPLG